MKKKAKPSVAATSEHFQGYLNFSAGAGRLKISSLKTLKKYFFKVFAGKLGSVFMCSEDMEDDKNDQHRMNIITINKLLKSSLT